MDRDVVRKTASLYKIADSAGLHEVLTKQGMDELQGMLDNLERTSTDWLTTYKNLPRHYHTTQHAVDVYETSLMLLGTYDYEFNAHSVRNQRVMTALFALYHDCIYAGGGPGESEYLSANKFDYTLRLCGSPYVDMFTVYTGILFSADYLVHKPYLPSLIKVWLDADLWAIGGDYTTYAENTHLIRKEFGHVPIDQFIAGRIKFLDAMLKRAETTGLYYNALLGPERNAAAISNMQVEREVLFEGQLP